MIHFKPFNGWFNNNLPLYYTQDITLLETVQHLICDYNEKLKIIEDSYNSLESTVYETFEKWERLFEEFTTKIENEWAEYKRNMRTEWENYKENLNNEWAEYKQNMRTEWNNYKDEMNAAFNQLKADMEAYKTEITTAFNELKAEFEALEDNVEAFKSNMTDKFTQLRNDWDSYKTNLTAEWEKFKEDTKNDLTEYKTNLTNEWTKFKTDTTNDLTEYKTNLTNEWATYKNEMNDNYNEFSENITAKITALEAEWDSFESAQNNKYNEFTASITEQINTIKSEWAAKQEEINETISNIENEWTAFEGDITTQWNNYKTEVNNTIEEFETEWAGWQETITNITNDNTQIKQDIETLKTTVEDLQEQINNIQPGENGIAFIVADENTEIDADTYINQKSVLQFNNTNTFTNFPTDFSVSGVGYLWNLSGGQIISLINEDKTNLINYTRKTSESWVGLESPIYFKRTTQVFTSAVTPNGRNFSCYTRLYLEDEIKEIVKKEYKANFTDEINFIQDPSNGLMLTDSDECGLLLLNTSVATNNPDNTPVYVATLLMYDFEKKDWVWIPSANAVFNGEQFKNIESSIETINNNIETLSNRMDTMNTSITTMNAQLTILTNAENTGGILNFSSAASDNSSINVGSQAHATPMKSSVLIGLLNLPDLPTTFKIIGTVPVFPGFVNLPDFSKVYITAEAYPVDSDVGLPMTFSGTCQAKRSGSFELTAHVNGAAPLQSDYFIILKAYSLN